MLEEIFSGFKSFAILVIANFANINSNEYFCPVGYSIVNLLCSVNGRKLTDVMQANQA
mgnify:CR=1 FL=1